MDYQLAQLAALAVAGVLIFLVAQSVLKADERRKTVIALRENPVRICAVYGAILSVAATALWIGTDGLLFNGWYGIATLAFGGVALCFERLFKFTKRLK